MNDTSTTSRWTVRDLPLAARLTLAAFLISTGIGYFSALVQLHFQHAKPGEMMPTAEDAARMFTLQKGKSQLMTLIEAAEDKPFNGGGQMSAAFTKRSVKPGWNGAVLKKYKDMGGRSPEPNEEDLQKAEEALRKERDAEKAAVLAWLRDGFTKDSYEKDRFPLPDDLKTLPITTKYIVPDDQGPCLKIKTLWEDRCVRCHSPGADQKAEKYPLETFEQIAGHNQMSGGGKSLTSLAQTTHVHLLGFSMLYGLTGLILALTRLPAFIRVPLAPLPLAAQVIDISFWWLARMDAPYGTMFAHFIPISGAVVGASLGLHILLSLFCLFGRVGRLVLVLLMVTAGYGAYVVKDKVIDPHMESERTAITAKK